MNNHTPYQTGAVRLPPREFLKTLPVRVSHLMFETESEDDLPWKLLRKKLSDLSSPSDLPDERNEPIYFLEREHEQRFQQYKSNNYLNLKRHELPFGSFWVVRFERHNHYVTFTFHRYFESPCTFITNGGILDFLSLQILNYNDDFISRLLKSTAQPGGNIDLAIVPDYFDKDELAKELRLDVESPYVTKSLIFDGMAEILISFPISDNLTEKPRPVIVRGLAYESMSEREAGDIIQILLQIEDYRTIATGKTFRKASKDMLDSLVKNAKILEDVRKACKNQIFEKSQASPPRFPLLHDLITVEDYLPIQNMLMRITFDINDETEQYTKQYDTAQAYNALVLDRLDDLREKPISHEPTIKTHLRHRIAQIGQSYQAIGLRQQCFARELSQLDGLLRS